MSFLVGFTMFLWVFLKAWTAYSLVMIGIHVIRNGYTPGFLEALWWVFLALFLFKGTLDVSKQ